MTIKEAAAFLRNNDNFLITSHVNPDGDGVGSILGLAGLLRQLGKNFHVICADPPQDKLGFLHAYNIIETFDEAMRGKISFEAAIVIDSPHMDRVGATVSLLKKDAKLLVIDHHISCEPFGTVNLIIPEAAASAQIVAMLYDELGKAFDANSAEALYVGLSIDTGRFRFSNVTPAVFRLAARLVEAGAAPDILADRLYYSDPIETKIGLAKVIESIELHNGGKAATAWLDYDFINSEIGKKMDDEGFVNQPLAIKGVETAFLIREKERGKLRISLRSRTDAVDVNKLAEKFGGGGHARASGCRMEGVTIAEAKKLLLAALDGANK